MPANQAELGSPSPNRIVIAGGGIAAVEALMALKTMAPAHVEVELVAPRPALTYRPLSVAEPFGLVERHELDLAEIADEHDASYCCDALAEIIPERHVVLLRSGVRIPYDSLIVATGARSEPVLPDALTFRGPASVPAFRRLLDEVEAGAVSRLAFAVPGRVQWSLPLYELALMTAAYASARGLGIRIEFVTPEARPMALFGARVGDRLAQLLEDAGIRFRARSLPVASTPAHLLLASRPAIAADRVVALGRLRVNPIPGLPQGPRGFIATDSFGAVEGLEGVYAVGDASWYPVKQGGLAAQQADAAASAIAAAAGAPVQASPFNPVLRGLLLTGGASLYLRADGCDASQTVTAGPGFMPVAKVAGRYLAPYLSSRGSTSAAPLIRSRASLGCEHGAAVALALEAADAAAGCSDLRAALRWLGVAEGLNLALPAEYAAKRDEWRRADRLELAAKEVLAR